MPLSSSGARHLLRARESIRLAGTPPPLAAPRFAWARPGLGTGAALRLCAPISGQRLSLPLAASPPGACFSTSSSDGGGAAPGEPAVFSTELEALKEPLAFVNRHAEALDVLVPNLANQESLRCGSRVKYETPLAAQPPGTGKTVLGENITAILRRPREADVVAEAAIAERLRTAWCWGGGAAPAVELALRDPRDENLVMRTLLAHFPHHEETLLKLKHVTPLVIEMKGIVMPYFGLDFDSALAYAIFCASRKMDCSEAETESAFLAQPKDAQSSYGAVKTLLRRSGGAPVVLILDDITDLEDPDFNGYFQTVRRETPLHRAMAQLSATLQLLHGIPRCFVFCTGHSLWLSSRALVGSGSPLIVQPTLLQPLTAKDVEQALRLTKEAPGRSLLDSMGVAAPLVRDFAARAVELTGGVGRALQFVLRARQRAVLGGAPILNSREEVREALDGLLPRIAKISGVLLRVTWDGPAVAVAAKEIPAWTQQEEEQVRLLQLFARMLLLDAPFDPDFAIQLGGERLRLADAAVVLGLSYGPAPAPSDSASSADWARSRTHLRLIAGDWLCRSLLTEPSITSRPAVLASIQLLATMRSFGGTMRGRPFEMLCADALCHRSLLAPGQTLGQLLPHLGRSVCGSDIVPALRVVAFPKAVVNKDLQRLDGAAKASLLLSRDSWKGGAVVHSEDLPWILAEWLPENTIGVAADAQPGSQDFFIRLNGGVVGFAPKAASASAGTGWIDLRDELSKAPQLPAGTPYTLVLWSLNLTPQLRASLASAESAVFDEGKWYFRSEALVKEADSAETPAFEVPLGQQLVVANPHAPRGGGLHELLGSSVMDALRSTSGRTGRLHIAHLSEWMAKAVVQP
jgi:hypothetical protein